MLVGRRGRTWLTSRSLKKSRCTGDVPLYSLSAKLLGSESRESRVSRSLYVISPSVSLFLQCISAVVFLFCISTTASVQLRCYHADNANLRKRRAMESASAQAMIK